MTPAWHTSTLGVLRFDTDHSHLSCFDISAHVRSTRNFHEVAHLSSILVQWGLTSVIKWHQLHPPKHWHNLSLAFELMNCWKFTRFWPGSEPRTLCRYSHSAPGRCRDSRWGRRGGRWRRRSTLSRPRGKTEPGIEPTTSHWPLLPIRLIVLLSGKYKSLPC